MKATDLMVGDLVYRPACYDRVTEVRSNGIIGSDRLRGVISLADLQPIPLTEEMLKANGFYQESDDVVDMVWRDHPLRYANNYGYLYIVVRNEGAKDKEAHGHFPCKQVILDAKDIYVHELQRALRVCGYYEQADNFRIG